jgi:hypothetical protein
MPGSVNVFDNVMKEMITLCVPEKVIDIGPGGGKYGMMLREIEAAREHHIWKTCVEIDNEKIIQRLGLHLIYDEIINEDAAKLPKAYPKLTADIVILGDVIEHLTKSEGIDLIEYLQYRARHIFLVIPTNFPSYDFEDYDHESHIAIWRKQDIERFEGAYCIQREHEGVRYLLISVNGINVRPRGHIVVRDNFAITGRLQATENGIEFGFLNRD